MAKTDRETRERPSRCLPTDGHDLVALAGWIPAKQPTEYESEYFDVHEYRIRGWRCRRCGEEHSRPEAFDRACESDRPPSPALEGGYSVADPRTRRAITEDMVVRAGERRHSYEVDSESGNTYVVDVAAATCSCPDHVNRETFCKHLRRVDLEIRAGTVPGPDGRVAGLR